MFGVGGLPFRFSINGFGEVLVGWGMGRDLQRLVLERLVHRRSNLECDGVSLTCLAVDGAPKKVNVWYPKSSVVVFPTINPP